MTCLDDLKSSIDALVAALDGSLGGSAITISTEANADANASSTSYAVNNVQIAAIAVATANALALLDIDISVSLSQTTLIKNVVLPPVSTTVPPNTTVFPEVDTGVSATARDETSPGGNLCQAVYYVVDSLASLATYMSYFPEIGYLAASAMAYVIIPAIQAAEFFLETRGIIIPKPALATLAAFMMGLQAANISVKDMLENTAFYLVDQRDAVAELIYCKVVFGTDTARIAQEVYDVIEVQLGFNEAQFLSILLTPNLLASLMYESTIYDASAQTETCDFCE